MEQVLVKKKLPELEYELFELLQLEEAYEAEEHYEEKQPLEKQKPLKKGLFKLFNKGKNNAKYLEELIPIEKVKQQGLYRNFGIF